MVVARLVACRRCWVGVGWVGCFWCYGHCVVVQLFCLLGGSAVQPRGGGIWLVDFYLVIVADCGYWVDFDFVYRDGARQQWVGDWVVRRRFVAEWFEVRFVWCYV